MLHEADDVERVGEFAGVVADLAEDVVGERDRREHAGGVAGVDAGLFDVLHDAGDDDVGSVAEGVHVYFGRVFEEVVDEDGALLRIFDGGRHVLADFGVVVGDDHGAAAEHVAGADEDGIADAVCPGQGFVEVGGDAPSGCGICKSSMSLPKRLRSSARSMDSGEVPMIGTPAAFSGRARLSGVWPPNWTIMPMSAPLAASCS